MTNIYANVDQNKRKTVLIILLFIGLISAIGWIVGELYLQDGIFFLGFALIVSGLSSFISYYNSDKIVLAISGAHEAKQAEHPQLHALVENMCIASGLPKPRIYLINDTAMNAFATGRDPEHAVICFTTGIVQALEKRELEGVIAHELSHIGNYDIRLMSIVSILVGTVTLLVDWFTHGMFYKRSNRDNDSHVSGLVMIVGILFLVLSPLIAFLIQMAVSRNREYLADASGVMLTRNPDGLVSALRKLSSDREVLEAANGATAHLYIVNPLKSINGGSVANLFSTHPPVEERIKRLLML